jgi:hypothetical protein
MKNITLRFTFILMISKNKLFNLIIFFLPSQNEASEIKSKFKRFRSNKNLVCLVYTLIWGKTWNTNDL